MTFSSENRPVPLTAHNSVPAAAVVAEAMTALALVNPFLEKFGGDSVEEILRRVGELR